MCYAWERLISTDHDKADVTERLPLGGRPNRGWWRIARKCRSGGAAPVRQPDTL